MSTTVGSRPYRGIPMQERRAQRREALIRAAIGVYGERGYRNATVRAVCEAAGITERYFYESFPNSEALLAASFVRVNETLLARMAAEGAACAGDAAAKTAALLRAYYRTLRDNPGGARVFLVEIAGVSPAIDRVVAQVLDRFGDLLARSIAPEHPDAAPALLRAGVVGGVVHIALGWIASAHAEPVEQVAAQALRLCHLLAPGTPLR